MKPEWKALLTDAGAEFDENRVESFGNAERERRVSRSGNILCDLSHYGLIAAQGEDCVDFLQGQFTNDVTQVDETHSQLSSYCNPKGRMMSNFRLFSRDDTLYISLPYELLEAIMGRLRMFVMRSKVTLEDADDALVRFGYNGPDAEEKLQAITGSVPRQVGEIVQVGSKSIIRVHGTLPRFEIYGQLEDMTRLWQALDVDAAPVGADAWELLNIQAGVPVITAGTIEAYVPQMANMDILDAISFKKGCYTGQEIVARMHYLGKLKRRMYRIRVLSDEAPAAGDKLFAEQSSAGSGTGSIVSAQQATDGGYEALAVIQIADAQNHALKLHDADGADIELLDLPYSLEVKE